MPRNYNVDEYEVFAERLQRYLYDKGIKRTVHAIDDMELLKNYLEVKFRLKRVPLQYDLEKFGKYARNTYRHHFRSYDNFLMIIKEDLSVERRRRLRLAEGAAGSEPPETRTIDYIREYFQLKQQLGRKPTENDIAEHSKYGLEGFRRVFIDIDKIDGAR